MKCAWIVETLDRLMYRANIDHEINFQGQQLAIVEAIELATQLRAKSRFYKELLRLKKKRSNMVTLKVRQYTELPYSNLKIIG